MEITKAQDLAEHLMAIHGVGDWYFAFNNHKRTYGRCVFTTKTIFLSDPLTRVSSEESVRDTILHEIAHAVAGIQAGHGPEWKKVARRLGANPDASADGPDAPSPYKMVCPNCGHEKARYRKTKARKACGICCDKYNGGKFTEVYEMFWVDTRVGV